MRILESFKQEQRTLVLVGKELTKNRDQLNEFIDETSGFLSMEMIEDSDPLVVKKVDDMIVGICGVRRSELINSLYLYVKKEFRGMGYGTELVKMVIEQSKGKMDSIVLSVRMDNAPAIHIYKTCGFKRLYQFKLSGVKCWRMFIPLNRKGWFTPFKLVVIDLVYRLKCIKSLEPLINHLTKYVKKYLLNIKG